MEPRLDADNEQSGPRAGSDEDALARVWRQLSDHGLSAEEIRTIESLTPDQAVDLLESAVRRPGCRRIRDPKASGCRT